jgi:hypothetical protein
MSVGTVLAQFVMVQAYIPTPAVRCMSRNETSTEERFSNRMSANYKRPLQLQWTRITIALTVLRTYRLTHFRTYSLTHLQTYRLTHLQTYALTVLRTYSLTHLQSYSLTVLRAYRLTVLRTCRLTVFRTYRLTVLRTYSLVRESSTLLLRHRQASVGNPGLKRRSALCV